MGHRDGLRRGQSSQLQDMLFPSISSMIFFTSFSSASLRRRSQTAPYQITGYCMSAQATSTTTQALGFAFTSCPMVAQLAAVSAAQKIIQPSDKKRDTRSGGIGAVTLLCQSSTKARVDCA